MRKIWCPGCDQGWVVCVRIIGTNTTLLVCEECETTWTSQEGVGRDKPSNFVDYMRSRGFRGVWSEVEGCTDESEP
jgi:hypothetical protein